MECYGYIKRLVQWKNDPNFWFLNQSPSQTLQQGIKDLDFAFQRFFANPSASGYPNWKIKGINDSIRFPQGFSIEERNKRVKLPKLGWIRFKRSRAIKGVVRHVTITKEANAYYIVFTTFEETPDPVLETESAVGIDLGVKIFAACSDGNVYHAPVDQYERNERKIKRTQQKLCRQKKGSKNREKTKLKLSKLHRKLRNTRLDFTHKLSSGLAKSHGTIYMEDLRVKQMSKSARGTKEKPGVHVRQKAGLNRSILRQGWGLFRTQLAYKLEAKGGQLILVDPKHTSQTCPVCGHVSKENRTTQEHFCCVNCGHEANADLNAAKNILLRGKVIRAGHAHCAC